MNKNGQILLIAKSKGYIVDNNGEVWLRNRKRSLNKDQRGYSNFTIRCNLGNGDVLRRVWVHRLQALQKFGDKIFCDEIMVRHLNGNKSDNSFTNIEIGTASDNMMDIPIEERTAHAKLAVRVLEKRVMAADIVYNSYMEAARKLGVSNNGIKKRIKLGWRGYAKID